MQTIIFIVIAIVLLLILVWMLKSECFNPGYNPIYDRSFNQTVFDHQSDYMKDMRGMTADDYSLEDTLYKQHAKRKEISNSTPQV
jgi:hypothetical protein